MQWDASKQAGFTSDTPWLPLGPNYHQVNVDRLRDDPASILTLYRRLIAVRSETAALAIGEYDPVEVGNDVIAYIREYERERVLVALNLTHAPQMVAVPGVKGRVLLSTHLDMEGREVDGEIDLRADEGLVLFLD